MSSFFIGRDLGQSRDYTALVVLELVPVNGEKPFHHLRYLAALSLSPNPPKDVLWSRNDLVDSSYRVLL